MKKPNRFRSTVSKIRTANKIPKSTIDDQKIELLITVVDKLIQLQAEQKTVNRQFVENTMAQNARLIGYLQRTEIALLDISAKIGNI